MAVTAPTAAAATAATATPQPVETTKGTSSAETSLTDNVPEPAATSVDRLASRLHHAKDFLLEEVLLARRKTISGGLRLFERPLSSRNINSNHNNHNNLNITTLNITPDNMEPKLTTQWTSP